MPKYNGIRVKSNNSTLKLALSSARTVASLRMWMRKDNEFFSSVMEEKVSNLMVVKVANVAFALAVALMSGNIFLTFIGVMWFVKACRTLKR